MTDETTTEQLAEIEGQAGTVCPDFDEDCATMPLADVQKCMRGVSGVIGQQVVALAPINGVCAELQRRQTTSEQPAEIEGQADTVQVREGRWRTRGGEEIPVTAMPTDHVDFSPAYPWWCGDRTWTHSGHLLSHGECSADLVKYLGPVKPQPEQPPQPQPQQAAAIDELRSEVSYVQRLLGLSNRKVAELEELVTSLRTINEAQERAFNAANKANDDLQHRLDTVAVEWSQQAETIRQLRADLAEVTRERDQYLDSYQRILGDLETIRETTAAETVEAIVEWLQAFRGCNSPALALLLLEALPSIMRTLTGLSDEEIE